MRFRVDVLGLTVLDVTTGPDSHRLDDPGPSGADAVTERRPSPDLTWTHTEPAVPDQGDRIGFRARRGESA